MTLNRDVDVPNVTFLLFREERSCEFRNSLKREISAGDRGDRIDTWRIKKSIHCNLCVRIHFDHVGDFVNNPSMTLPQ